jgi:hydroxysqualene dehydroxylase
VFSSPDVFVIGAGFAGLAAATALAHAGVRVHVLEARPRLGGRATAFRDPITGEPIDNGQHVIAGCYTETLTLLRRIGAADRVHRPSTLRVPMIDEDGRPSVLALPPLPAPVDLISGVLAWDALSLYDRVSILRMGSVLRKAPRPEASITVRQWLERQRQSPRLCRMLWEPLALAALNQTVDDAAAASFIAVIERMFGSGPDAATLLLPAVSLDALYAHPAADFLARAGSKLTTNAPAHVEIDNGRVTAVRVRGNVMRTDVVISAVPWFGFRALFDNVPSALALVVDNASTLESSPIVTVNLWFESDVLGNAFVGFPGRTFQWAFDRRRLTGAAQSHISLVSSGAAAVCAMPNQALVALAMSELTSAIPAVRQTRLRHASVVRERRATFSLKPGSPDRPGTRTAVEGLWLAGDWIDTGLPATIESAVLSGHRAAEAVLASLS